MIINRINVYNDFHRLRSRPLRKITDSDNKISDFVIFTTYEDNFPTKPLVYGCSADSATPKAHSGSLYALDATPQVRVG
jgi:hypothetical protein